MYTNVNLAAPIGALALLGTGGLLFLSALVLLHEGDWITHSVIGHENSLFHKQTRFQIDLKSNQAAITDHGE